MSKRRKHWAQVSEAMELMEEEKRKLTYKKFNIYRYFISEPVYFVTDRMDNIRYEVNLSTYRMIQNAIHRGYLNKDQIICEEHPI